MKKISSEMLFRIGSICLWILYVYYTIQYWIGMDGKITITPSGWAFLIGSWVVNLLLIMCMIFLKNVECKVIWIIWGWFVFGGLRAMFINGKSLIQVLEVYLRDFADASSLVYGFDYIFHDIVSSMVLGLIMLIAYAIILLLWRKDSTVKRILLGLCWMAYILIKGIMVYDAGWRIRFSVCEHYEQLSSYYFSISVILFWGWLLIKKKNAKCKQGLENNDKYNFDNLRGEQQRKNGQKDESYRICPKCQKRVAEENRFCGACGFSMETDVEPNVGKER